MHKNPFEKGRLFIKFSIVFPQDHFLDVEGMKKLEALLPGRTELEPVEGDTEEVALSEYDRNQEFGSRRGRVSSC